MDEGRLEGGEDADKLFHRHVVLRRGRIVFAKGVLDHFRGEIGKGQRTGPRRVDKELAVIQMLAALFVIKSGIYINAMHGVESPFRPLQASGWE